MKNKINFCILSIIFFILPSCSGDDDCTVGPDLTSDLLVPSANIILGEPVDWDYVVESFEDNEDCKILSAAASIGQIIIDFFDDDGRQATTVFMALNDVNQLDVGDIQTISNTINVFNDEGIYTITVTADQTNLVDERNESNNTDALDADASETRLLAGLIDGNFEKVHSDFYTKIHQVSAAVVISEQSSQRNDIQKYNGVPIYFGKKK